jgi:uncharacterized protein YprB with RNaseH-like and TPR domain
MPGNLKARLARIRDLKYQNEKARPEAAAAQPEIPAKREAPASLCGVPRGFGPEWQSAGYKVLKRSVSVGLPSGFPKSFPKTLAILVPDFFRYVDVKGCFPAAEDLLFFDLETTGLSGGAGTVAFLAAFGRVSQGEAAGGEPRASRSAECAAIVVTQYLLLDYSGETDFLNAMLAEFSSEKSVVSYNGKAFDSQILKTRCLMNGFTPPLYHHADLLHPARRLWKKILDDCSQKTIETEILGLDRAGDISGAEAPEIWFSFLKTGLSERLLGICDHNLRDIKGLAVMFAALSFIASSPLNADTQFVFNAEALAIRWREALLRRPRFFGPEENETGSRLLDAASSLGSVRTLVIKAKDAEWRLGDFAAALLYTETALSRTEAGSEINKKLIHRRERLLRKRRFIQ